MSSETSKLKPGGTSGGGGTLLLGLAMGAGLLNLLVILAGGMGLITRSLREQ